MLRYVALGDSYTIGTAVAPPLRFPDQLVAALPQDPPALRLEANLGVNGFTSRQLIDEELPALEVLAPDFMTVLIGVNDVVRRVPPPTYEGNVVTILDALLARLAPDRIIAVGIPDYTVTPQGGAYGEPSVQSAAIQAGNTVMAQRCAERAIPFVDIFDLSLRAATDRTLVADDGLHPSGAQYALWVERLLPAVRASLGV